MPRSLYPLLLLVPAALGTRLLALPAWLVFALATASLVPLAGLIGKATEELARHLGPRAGGLLNATFGNAAELIIGGFAIHHGLLTLVKASITGSIIGNTLLVLGASLLAGGIRHGEQRYDPRRASLNATMMILAVAALYLPATFALSARVRPRLEGLSLSVAGVLLLTYGAYLAYTVSQDRRSARPAVGPPGREVCPRREMPGLGGEASWGAGRALLVLAGAVVGTGVSSELLVNAVEPVTRQLGWSEFFVGVIIVPIVGNAAEHFTAVQQAWRDRLELTLAITAGSSTQVALLVAPALVFLSLALGHPLDLIFTPLELGILGLATLIFAYISLDGESNWLEGVQLLALYAVAGLVFAFLPPGSA